MIRLIGKTPERLNIYDVAEKVVLTVLTAGQTVYISTNINMLRGAGPGGTAQGVPLSSASGSVALSFKGDVWWAATAEGVQVDVLEGGTL